MARKPKREITEAGDNVIASWAADLLELEEQINALQDGKKDLYASIREDHGRVLADAVKNAVRLSRMDDEKRERVEATDTETERVLRIIASPRAPAPPARAREIIEEFSPETGEIIESNSANPAPGVAADQVEGLSLSPQRGSSADQIEPSGNSGELEPVQEMHELPVQPSEGPALKTADEAADVALTPVKAGQARQAGEGGGDIQPSSSAPNPETREGVAGLSPSARNALDLRPWCQHASELSKCAGQGRKHCFTCLKAHADDVGEAA